MNLCSRCHRLLRPVAGRRCSTCLARIEDFSAPSDFVCGACRRRPPPWNRLIAGWFYEPPLRDVVIGLKFARLEYLAAALAAEVAERHAHELGRCEAIVPIPLHWWRGLTRGYNQADLLARALARDIDRPVVQPLVRRRSTRAQTGLDRAARRRNLRDAFAWRGSPAAAGQRWLLVDDVYTTGATLESAARALRRGGAKDVTALVIAVTPDPAAGEMRNRVRNSPLSNGVGRR